MKTFGQYRTIKSSIFFINFWTILIFLLCSWQANGAISSISYRDFWHPNYHGERLNYCSLDNKFCGISIATQYCRLMGYHRAKEAIIAYNVGLTHFMAYLPSSECTPHVSSKQQHVTVPMLPESYCLQQEGNYSVGRVYCKGWECHGFKMIRCEGSLAHNPAPSYAYQYRRFVYPRFNHYRVDWCYDGDESKSCGRKPAFSFCRRMGYRDVHAYHIEKGIGATQAIGNQKLCFGNRCAGFASIECTH